MVEDERFFSRQIYLVARRSVNSEARSISSASKVSSLSSHVSRSVALLFYSPFIPVMVGERRGEKEEEKKN